jgi:hypothetical protein
MASVLEREMYTEAEAARLLRVSQSTLHYWLEGGGRDGRHYKPVVRLQPTGRRSVTWAEFVEYGVELEELADTYQLTVGDVRWAIAYENAVRAA